MKLIPEHSLSSLALLLLLLSSCGGGGASGGGTVVVEGTTTTPPPLYEIEPNDVAAYADYIGEIIPGDYIEIEGHITECCPDPYDGFAFYAPGPVEVILTLNEANLAADLDFCIYDPTIDQMIACWETDLHPEVGIFDYAGGGEFHVVIRSYIGDSNYLLEVDVRPLPPSVALLTGGPGEPQSAPSPSAIERFADYSAPRKTRAESPVLGEQLLLREDASELLLLPGGVLRSGGH